ncbi:hypothetical protein AB0C34_26915 [Nocardia sp. NPDC049220]|uniref:hypothetical protein n=1 Tax=Nocardia sp. NPDC049220 TaxID=3155273 RepID=UPI0033DEDB6D
MVVWGDNHLVGPEGPPIGLEHHSCGSDLADAGLRPLREPRDPREVEPKAGTGFRQPLSVAEYIS